MQEQSNIIYIKNKTTVAPNRWDILALLFLFGMFALLAWAASNMVGPYRVGQALPISLDVHYLPYYALRSVLRLFIALFFSLLFTFTIATWAAKSQRAEKLIIPLIDICQSVPVLGFLAISVTGFIMLFPNSMLGPEFACIFAIFTAQVWNMALSFYQSLSTVPHEIK